jgi:hypothetical protein
VAKALGRDNIMALEDMGGSRRDLTTISLPAEFEGAHVSGRPGSPHDEGSRSDREGASSDDDLDADYDMAHGLGPKCINCTAPLYMDHLCTVRSCPCANSWQDMDCS